MYFLYLLYTQRRYVRFYIYCTHTRHRVVSGCGCEHGGTSACGLLNCVCVCFCVYVSLSVSVSGCVCVCVSMCCVGWAVCGWAGRCVCVCVCVCVCEEWQSSDGYQPSDVVSNDSGVCVCVCVCLYTRVCMFIHTHTGITSAILRMHDIYVYKMAVCIMYTICTQLQYIGFPLSSLPWALLLNPLLAAHILQSLL